MPAPQKIDPVAMERMWLADKRLADIAERFDVSEAAVSKLARVIGIPKRKPGPRRNAVMQSQNKQILAYLTAGHRLTGLDALRRFGVSHLPRRILDLKESGHKLESEWVRVTKANGDVARVKEWRLG